MHRTCQRCTTINAGDGWQVLACVVHGEIWEAIVHEYNGTGLTRSLVWAA